MHANCDCTHTTGGSATVQCEVDGPPTVGLRQLQLSSGKPTWTTESQLRTGRLQYVQQLDLS